MNKLLIKFSCILLILSLEACSYKPIHSYKKVDFGVGEIIFIGEKEINEIIERKLDLNKKNSGKNKKIYNLEIETFKRRIIVSKDSKGDPLKFELIINTNYKVFSNGNLILVNEIEKNNIYNNETDKFKLDQNEKITIENMSEIISDNIVSSIININDS